MTALTADQVITLTEILVILLGLGITWAIYYGSKNAELPGEAREPTPALPDDTMADLRGRTL